MPTDPKVKTLTANFISSGHPRAVALASAFAIATVVADHADDEDDLLTGLSFLFDAITAQAKINLSQKTNKVN